MKRAGLCLALTLVVGACSHSSVRVEQGSAESLGRFRRLGVLPFADSQGQGAAIAAKLNSRLAHLDYNVIDSRQLEMAFSALKLDYTSALSLSTLREVRQSTLADALVFGALDSHWSEVAVIVIETQTAEVVLNAKIKPRRGKTFSGIDEAVEETARVFAQLPAGPRRKEMP